MKHQTHHNHPALLLGVVGFVGLAVCGQASDTVHAGWDLWTTLPSTTFGGANFQGVPLVNYDFGGSIGNKYVGNTDTIVQRLSDAHAASETIRIELAALHMQSVAPANFGLGLGTYYVTLQSERGGPESQGWMTINFGPEGNPHGTFNSFFDVFFDIRLDALDGPIAMSGDLPLTSTGPTGWSHESGSLLIPGVNYLLNGVDISQDFWPIGPVDEAHPIGAHHIVIPVPEVPVPTPLMLLGLGSLAWSTLQRSKQTTSTATSV